MELAIVFGILAVVGFTGAIYNTLSDRRKAKMAQ